MKQKLKSTAVSYSIMEHLGEGLNSVVYKAIRSDPFHHLSQTVALKILKSKNLVEIWKNEFASLEHVVCKHCVRVYGFEWVGDRPALVLEYVSGISLRQLGLAGPLTKTIAQEVLAQIQVGLNSLKDQGLSHGDLSPNNVMIDETGLVRLLDFGWANNIEGRVQTTHAFAAPELLAGGRPNFQTDLYSLGALEKMLTQTTSNRLSVEAHSRTPFEQTPNVLARKKLSKRVRHVRHHQNLFVQMATKSVVFGKRVRWPIVRIAVILSIMLSLPTSQTFVTNFLEFGLIKIRTLGWTKLQINGVDIGFSPQDLLVRANDMQVLTWQTQTERGQLAIKVARAQAKVLREQELHP